MNDMDRRQRGTIARTFIWLLVVVLGACRDEAVAPDQSLEPFWGDWAASSLVVTSVADPAVSPDLVELGATFDLNVQPSGQYTAILVFAQQSATEIGQLSVSGSNFTLRPTFPPGQPSTVGVWARSGDVLTLDGSTRFDFNLDGTPEAALARFVLVRQQ